MSFLSSRKPKWMKGWTKFRPDWMRNRKQGLDYYADGVGVKGKNLSFFESPQFAEAWEFSRQGNIDSWNGNPPDVRWRASVCCWAAENGLHLQGDFIECGVNTGLLSMTVCHYLDFSKVKKQFHLYDTFEGIPEEALSGNEASTAKEINTGKYFDCWEIAKRNFSSFDNVTLVRGRLPDTLSGTMPEKIAYLSIDLNSATYEKQVIDILWDKIVPGAIIVLDDYGFKTLEAQYEMWNEFALSKEHSVLLLPTGQGLIIKAAM